MGSEWRGEGGKEGGAVRGATRALPWPALARRFSRPGRARGGAAGFTTAAAAAFSILAICVRVR